MLTADLFAEIVDLSFDVAPVVACHHDDYGLVLEIKGVVISDLSLSVALAEASADQDIAVLTVIAQEMHRFVHQDILLVT